MPGTPTSGANITSFIVAWLLQAMQLCETDDISLFIAMKKIFYSPYLSLLTLERPPCEIGPGWYLVGIPTIRRTDKCSSLCLNCLCKHYCLCWIVACPWGSGIVVHCEAEVPAWPTTNTNTGNEPGLSFPGGQHSTAVAMIHCLRY